MISIHALHEEGDACKVSKSKLARLFQSTPSMRRATWQSDESDLPFHISIHALHEEGDVYILG